MTTVAHVVLLSNVCNTRSRKENVIILTAVPFLGIFTIMTFIAIQLKLEGYNFFAPRYWMMMNTCHTSARHNTSNTFVSLLCFNTAFCLFVSYFLPATFPLPRFPTVLRYLYQLFHWWIYEYSLSPAILS
jgi:hypothetical protein